MSFISNVRINNIAHDLRNLETTVANMQISGAPVIAGNIDMNNFGLTEVNDIVFNDSKVLTSTTAGLQYNNNTVLTSGEGFLTSNITTDLNLNGHALNNVHGMVFEDSQIAGNKYAMVTYGGTIGAIKTTQTQDVQLCLTVNETPGFTQNLNLLNNSFTNINYLHFYNNGLVLQTAGIDLVFNNNTVVDSNNISSYLTTVQDDITAIQGDITTINTNIGNCLNTTAQTDLNMNGHNIADIQSLTIRDAITNNLYELTTYSGYPVSHNTNNVADVQMSLTVNQTAGQPCNLNLLQNGFTNVSSVAFTNGGTLSNDTSNNLTFNSDIVLNQSNWQTYINPTEWNGNATDNINMNNYNIIDAQDITFHDNSKAISQQMNNIDGYTNLNYSSGWNSMGANSSSFFASNTDLNPSLIGAGAVWKFTVQFTLASASQFIFQMLATDSTTNLPLYSNPFIEIDSSAFATDGATTYTYNGTLEQGTTGAGITQNNIGVAPQSLTTNVKFTLACSTLISGGNFPISLSDYHVFFTAVKSQIEDYSIVNTGVNGVIQLGLNNNLISTDGVSNDLLYNNSTVLTTGNFDTNYSNLITTNNITGYLSGFQTSYVLKNGTTNGTSSGNFTFPPTTDHIACAFISGTVQAYSAPPSGGIVCSCIKFEGFIAESSETVYVVDSASVSTSHVSGTGITGMTLTCSGTTLSYGLTFSQPQTFYNITYRYDFYDTS